MVTCWDEAGRSVSWSGPKGSLGTKSHPGVEVSSYGTSLAFMPVTKEDSGTYSCRVGHDVAQFHLTVEGTNFWIINAIILHIIYLLCLRAYDP